MYLDSLNGSTAIAISRFYFFVGNCPFSSDRIKLCLTWEVRACVWHGHYLNADTPFES